MSRSEETKDSQPATNASMADSTVKGASVRGWMVKRRRKKLDFMYKALDKV
jgi:hypothetical protein